VERLEGPAEAKRRLRVVLETLTGERGVGEAAAELGLSEARFHQLRRQVLESALDGLCPQAPGRPRKPEPPPSRIEELEHELQELRIDLQAARVRTEIALTMPHLLRDGKEKKGSRAKAGRGRRRGRR
jgi:transposase-like protein